MMQNKTEIYQREEFGRQPALGIHERDVLTLKAKFAADIVGRWGHYAIVAGDLESADKVRLLAPSELVSRAVETTELFFAECDKRGWIIEMPPLADIRSLPKFPE